MMNKQNNTIRMEIKQFIDKSFSPVQSRSKHPNNYPMERRIKSDSDELLHIKQSINKFFSPVQFKSKRPKLNYPG
jgi:hypothetical protein